MSSFRHSPFAIELHRSVPQIDATRRRSQSGTESGDRCLGFGIGAKRVPPWHLTDSQLQKAIDQVRENWEAVTFRLSQVATENTL